MKRFHILVLSALLSSCATSPDKDLSGFATSASKGFDLPKYENANLENSGFEAKSAFIFSILYHTSELNIHRMNGQSENQVFVHEQGGEAVYDKNGKLVTDCNNKGSFNYAHYKREPLEHFSVDILPWLRWGNCREDPTSIEQRIEAYALDFRSGFDIASSDARGYFLPAEFDLSAPTISVTLAFFLEAFESSGFDLYTFIMKNQKNTEERIKFIEALKNGFKSHFENA